MLKLLRQFSALVRHFLNTIAEIASQLSVLTIHKSVINGK